MGSVNATLATSATTVTAPRRRRHAFQMTSRCAMGEATVCAVAVSVLSQGPLETPVKNAPPALMPVVLKGDISNNSIAMEVFIVDYTALIMPYDCAH